ncbi:MAG: signal peptidase I [Clostridia bacterium]|nr:signal peptidase I [Clostridia bacterium]
MKKQNKDVRIRRAEIPTEEAVAAERERLQYRKKFRGTMFNTIYILVIVAAVAVLAATLFVPVLQVSGSSMEPSLSDGDVIVLFKVGKLETGDLCGFYYQNKLLLKRVIGTPGDIVDIDEDGNVTVNGEALEEDYVTNKALGECDIELPCQVPDNRYFVMGDNRTTSIDSRSSAIGCIEKDQLVGKVMFKVWPLSFG